MTTNDEAAPIAHSQWWCYTIKSGSAFKSQLYFQVGQIDGYLGLFPGKNQLLNHVFSAYLQTEMVSPAVLARLSIKHYNSEMGKVQHSTSTSTSTATI